MGIVRNNSTKSTVSSGKKRKNPRGRDDTTDTGAGRAVGEGGKWRRHPDVRVPPGRFAATPSALLGGGELAAGLVGVGLVTPGADRLAVEDVEDVPGQLLVVD